ncbi:CBS domain-containing protein [Nitrososphaera sp.]|uniref:CBS domain-containing protein n=1 Tax=Nitrososphaera sp. TaxID=1971748 RepID=UPI00307E824D
MSKRVRQRQIKTAVEDIMSNKVVAVDADSSVQQVAQEMAKRNVSSVILKDGEKMVGILTERDLVRNVCAKDALASKTPATAIMSAPVQSVNKNSAVEAAAKIMVDSGVRHLAVEDDYHELVGMVTATDMARHLRKRLDVSGAELELLEALYME